MLDNLAATWRSKAPHRASVAVLGFRVACRHFPKIQPYHNRDRTDLLLDDETDLLLDDELGDDWIVQIELFGLGLRKMPDAEVILPQKKP